MTPTDLKIVLDNHVMWLRGEGGVRAILDGADLCGAQLNGAQLNDACWCPTSILLAYWGNLSDQLTARCIAFDVANHPRGLLPFLEWARGGECPYNGELVSRVVNFHERKSCVAAAALVAPDSALSLARALIAECCK